MKIDRQKLIERVEHADLLKGTHRGIYELYRAAQDELLQLIRQRQTTAMRHEELRVKSPGDLERLDARIAALRTLVSKREAEAQAAGEIAAQAGRLAAACRAYARENDVLLPTENPLEIGYFGRADG